MEKNEINAIKERLKPKIEKGDFITLSKILETKPQTARARFNRSNQKAVELMSIWLDKKEEIINNLIKTL